MLVRLVYLLSLLCAVAVWPCLTQGNDWPEFRGPTGQGLASSPLPTIWGSDQHVTWSVDLPGKGWSSPVITSGKIYLTTAVQSASKDQSLRCLCLNAQNGATLWNQEIFLVPAAEAQATHTKNGHASPTPIVNDDHIFVHFGHYGTACLNPEGQSYGAIRNIVTSQCTVMAARHALLMIC